MSSEIRSRSCPTLMATGETIGAVRCWQRRSSPNAGRRVPRGCASLAVERRRRVRRSNALSDAVSAQNGCWPSGPCGPQLHLKSVSAGDLDGDGDVDLWVESGGGYDNPPPHAMINQAESLKSTSRKLGEATTLSGVLARGAMQAKRLRT